MKCVNCQTDNNFKDRTANHGRCKNCGHTFIFEPKKNKIHGTKLTDGFFKKAIANVSANQTLFFTTKQFQYFLDRILKNNISNLIRALFLYMFLNVGVSCVFGDILSESFGEIAFVIAFLFFNISSITYLVFTTNKSRKINYRTRQKNSRLLQIIGILLIFTGVFSKTIFLTDLLSISFIIFILGITSTILGTRQLSNKKPIPQTVLVSKEKVNNWLNIWQEINGSIQQLLPPTHQESLPAQIKEDIATYSFDRAVICDTAAIAQFLIANNFHLEKNCAILSITGYPQNSFNRIREMLRQNPNLKVYALHNASPKGVELTDNLRSNPKWFANTSANIYNLGILPQQILKLPDIFVNNSQASARLAKQISPQVRQKLTPEAIRWLELGNFIELESFAPQKLLRIVTKGIAQIERINPDNNDNLWAHSEIETEIYPFDSFG